MAYCKLTWTVTGFKMFTLVSELRISAILLHIFCIWIDRIPVSFLIFWINKYQAFYNAYNDFLALFFEHFVSSNTHRSRQAV